MLKLPIRYDRHEQAIRNGDGLVICLLAWAGIRRSPAEIDKIGLEIVERVNGAVLDPPGSGSLPEPIPESVNVAGNEHKGRGNPAFMKGKPNPYKKKLNQ